MLTARSRMAGPCCCGSLAGGMLSYSVALNYCELVTTYPVAGGAMSYVREAYGSGILSYLVGSMDCLSSTRCVVGGWFRLCCRSWYPPADRAYRPACNWHIHRAEPRCYCCNAQLSSGHSACLRLRGCGFCESQGLVDYTQGKDIDRRHVREHVDAAEYVALSIPRWIRGDC